MASSYPSATQTATSKAFTTLATKSQTPSLCTDTLASYTASPPLPTLSTSRLGTTLSRAVKTPHLKGSLGIKPAHGQALNTFDLDHSRHVLAPAFRSSKSLGHPVLLDASHESFEHFRSGIDWRGYLEPSSRIVVMPVLTTGLIVGFIVMGLNPRRPYDDDLKQLVRDIWLTCTSVLSLSISFDQAREREKVLTRELTQRECFIRKLAEVTNVGIYSLSPIGILTDANPKSHDMLESTLEAKNSQVFGFDRFVPDDDPHKITNVDKPLDILLVEDIVIKRSHLKQANSREMASSPRRNPRTGSTRLFAYHQVFARVRQQCRRAGCHLDGLRDASAERN